LFKLVKFQPEIKFHSFLYTLLYPGAGASLHGVPGLAGSKVVAPLENIVFILLVPLPHGRPGHTGSRVVAPLENVVFFFWYHNLIEYLGWQPSGCSTGNIVFLLPLPLTHGIQGWLPTVWLLH